MEMSCFKIRNDGELYLCPLKWNRKTDLSLIPSWAGTQFRVSYLHYRKYSGLPALGKACLATRHLWFGSCMAGGAGLQGGSAGGGREQSWHTPQAVSLPKSCCGKFSFAGSVSKSV